MAPLAAFLEFRAAVPLGGRLREVFFQYRNGSAAEAEGLGIMTLCLVQIGQIVEARCDIRVVGAECVL